MKAKGPEQPTTHAVHPHLRWLVLLLLFLLLITMVIYLIHDFRKVYGEWSFHIALRHLLHRDFLIFLLVGFLAQTIDGALGMAYGISSSSLLLTLGVPPPVTSACVHIAEVFTTGVSGFSHISFGNVNGQLFKKLVLPGIIGAVLGAYILSNFDSKIIRPFVAIYLMVVGLLIIKKAFGIIKPESEIKSVAILGLVGGFVDAVGGGGWGPVVTSTLIGKGHHPRFTIGSVNLAEFFVAVSSAGIFTLFLGVPDWNAILGLIIGGVLAAPLGALVIKKINPKKLMLLVGFVIIALSIRALVVSFW